MANPTVKMKNMLSELDLIDEEETKRRVEMKMGSAVIIKRTDPYGFWSIKLEKGPTPPHLAEQEFTNFHEAVKAVKLWASNTGREITKIDIGARTATEQADWEMQQKLAAY